MKKLNDKVALITGGNSGIGLATANLFREHGATVIITARSTETFHKAQHELGRAFDIVQTDVSNLGDLDRLYAHIQSTYGRLDIVFANAGVAMFRLTPECDLEFFEQHFNTNVKGLYYTVAKALPLLSKGSSVVLNASVAKDRGLPGASVYSATKAAARSFARSWTAEIPVEHVRFNVLSPGPIETPIFGKLGMSSEQWDAFEANTKAALPIHRFGTADEMAKAALFLASDDSSYLCGADLVADGGYSQV
jgi:NAD(P)-dependent dehydrogenase (short-subunit alcohol dehydrogenase family)